MIGLRTTVELIVDIFAVVLLVAIYWLRRRLSPMLALAVALGLSLAAGYFATFRNGTYQIHGDNFVSATVAGLLTLAYLAICWFVMGVLKRFVSNIRKWTDSM